MSELPTIRPESRMLIDGKLAEARDGATFEVINPANQAVVGSVADASAEDMAAAIDAARRAFDETTWSTDRELRKQCLTQLQNALDREVEEMREQLIQEAGAPRMLTSSAQLDTPLADAIRYPVKLIDEYAWEVDLGEAVNIQGNLDHRKVVSMAAGVVGAITPWNFPFEVTINKLAQALATGNTMVLKPAPDTPLNATLLGRIIAEQTDIPPGVVNIVPSSDHLRGEDLTLSPKVDLISFTGSTAVGQRIMEKGAATLKRLFLELGGKSATVVLDDADLIVASFMGLAVCTHGGQGCAIPTRMLLPRSRYDEGIEALVSMMQNVPYGDPQRGDVLQGPQISEKQRQRVLGYMAGRCGLGEDLTLIRRTNEASRSASRLRRAFQNRSTGAAHRGRGRLQRECRSSRCRSTSPSSARSPGGRSEATHCQPAARPRRAQRTRPNPASLRGSGAAPGPTRRQRAPADR